MPSMVSRDIPSGFAGMSKQSSIWLRLIDLLHGSLVFTNKKVSVPDSASDMSPSDTTALGISDVWKCQCLK
jgi:hypothetical protein